MSSASNSILRLITPLQAAGLAADNYAFAKKKRKKVKDFASQGVKNILGTTLIKTTDDFLWG